MVLLSFALAQSVTLHLNDPRTHRSPGDRCTDTHCRALLDRIEHAERSIDFAVYGFRDQSDVVDALERAAERGVRVRGVVDADANGVNYYADTADVRARLGGIGTDEASDRALLENRRDFRLPERCPRPPGFEGPLQCLGYDLGDRCLLAAHASREPITSSGAIQHNKFFVFDERSVWTGSTNVSDSGTGGYNANLVVTVDSPVVAGWYTQEVERMLEGQFHADKPRSPAQRWLSPEGVHVTGLFSPQDRPLTRGVRPLLQQAQHSIDVAVFFLTHKRITADLIAAHRRGVRVRVILDATAARNGYTKHEILRAAGIPVKVEDWGGKMHAKAAVIDGHTLVTGSMNWTSAGEGGNDENTLLLRSRPLARQFQSWFDALWASVPDRWTHGRPDPESLDSGSSCFDGVDNDFDHLADAQDPGCSAQPPAMAALPPYGFVAKQAGEGLLVKGVQKDGQAYWLGPWQTAYARHPADTWFCSRHDAEEAGYRRMPRSSP